MADPQHTFDLDGYLAGRRELVNRALRERLPARDAELDHLRLREAMREAVLAGGKRLRPCLVLAACEAVGGRAEDALDPACAVELVHCYSLVHDDLPAMDDDDVRRGHPTCHRQFGEAAAILVGDALLTLAFETLARETAATAARAGALGRAALELARAAGVAGMIGGQALDLELKERDPDFGELERCHSGKTAALFAASATVGALAGGGDAPQIEALRGFGHDLGLAFQHADDLRDAEFTRHRERALERAEELSRRAAERARAFGEAGLPLVALAELVGRRARHAIEDKELIR